MRGKPLRKEVFLFKTFTILDCNRLVIRNHVNCLTRIKVPCIRVVRKRYGRKFPIPIVNERLCVSAKRQRYLSHPCRSIGVIDIHRPSNCFHYVYSRCSKRFASRQSRSKYCSATLRLFRSPYGAPDFRHRYFQMPE